MVSLAQAAPPPAIPSNPDKNVYFGQTHSHTSWSMDAYIIGNTVTGPAEAYQFSMGQPIKHPGGYMVKLARPLDFQGVTDHSEYIGMVPKANDPTSPVSKLPIAAKLKASTQAQMVEVFKFLVSVLAKNEPIKDFLNPKLMANVWSDYVQIADKYYEPGKFTTFVSYEWTSAPGGQNLHRNIFFRDSKRIPAIPFTAIDSVHPEDLWGWMDGQRKQGNELLAISHNGNLSNGLMFPVSVDSKGRPLTAAWAQERLSNEPLTEMKQLKGTSETTPELSPNDEFANFEIYDVLITQRDTKGKVNGSYIRQAFGRGLVVQQKVGANPYKYGVVGGSDWHNGISASDENATAGSPGGVDPKVNLPDGDAAKKLLGIIQTRAMIDDDAAKAGRQPAIANPMINGSAGITGVWAEENTRASIFAALKRKETFATSGPRLRVRFFGGWGFTPAMLQRADWPAQAYRTGAPMGGDLPFRPTGAGAPSFIVQAVKDPDGANLDRVQIVKVWLEGDDYKEKVFDVALSGGRKADPRTGKAPAVGSTVDLKTATYKNTIGAATLQAVWRDPEFDAARPAVYYLRALEIPTPRWTTYLAAKRGLPLPSTSPATLQERAYSSPIWFTPPTAKPAKLARK